MDMTINTRQIGDVTIVDISGRIVLGEESAARSGTRFAEQGTQEDSVQLGQCRLHRQLRAVERRVLA
jgi:hypothetical protein